MRAARAVELGELLPGMRKGLTPSHVKERRMDSPRSVHIGVRSVVTLLHRGRPEPESGTPVNMENRLHRDNGEGVAATPPPYPLEDSPLNLSLIHWQWGRTGGWIRNTVTNQW